MHRCHASEVLMLPSVQGSPAKTAGNRRVSNKKAKGKKRKAEEKTPPTAPAKKCAAWSHSCTCFLAQLLLRELCMQKIQNLIQPPLIEIFSTWISSVLLLHRCVQCRDVYVGRSFQSGCNVLDLQQTVQHARVLSMVSCCIPLCSCTVAF